MRAVQLQAVLAGWTFLLLVAAYPGRAQTASKPAGAGQTRPSAPVKAVTAAIPAPITKPVAPPAAHVEFLRDVAPILDTNGCSTAGCHGKFGGRGNFQVSLLTLSPEDDWEPIVNGGRGRRINLAAPEQSLLLLKAIGAIPHGGGARFDTKSKDYQTLLRWIRQGAMFRPADPTLTKMVVMPARVTLQKAGQTQPLKVTATYSDGSTRDVTRQAVFQSTNEGVLKVDPSGLVTGKQWGGGAILARYLGTITPAFFTLPQTRKGVYPTIKTDNAIDRAVFDNLKRLNVLPSALSDDSEFLRRVTLDTLGRLPVPDEIAAFLADKRADKRTRLIDALLARPEFADYRSLRLADLLRVNPRKISGTQMGDRAAALFYEWIWNSVNDNKPWDQFAREIVTARGSVFQNGPACFYRIETEPNNRMENLGQAFLGVRMSCARCHKHPFDRWSTDDYWNFAAFESKVGLQGGHLYDETVVNYNGGAQVANQSVTGRNRGKVAPPTFLGDKQPAPAADDQIAALAAWMTDAKNPFFARAAVNRLWSYYFGRGVVHPVDDMRATTPPSVPGLIDALATELVQSKYDMKHVIRLILNSRTYQLSSRPNVSNQRDDRFFSHFLPKAMPAPVLLDMINQASGASESFSSFPERSRAVQAALPVSNYFLDSFGQSHREFLADIDPKLEPNLVQTLTMINSPSIEDKVRNGKSAQTVAKAAKTDEDVVKTLYLQTLSREPKPTEISGASALLHQAANRGEGAQDLLWALLTSREFYFNHLTRAVWREPMRGIKRISHNIVRLGGEIQ